MAAPQPATAIAAAADAAATSEAAAATPAPPTDADSHPSKRQKQQGAYSGAKYSWDSKWINILMLWLYTQHQAPPEDTEIGMQCAARRSRVGRR